jgi:FtsP/CotA-like multicopper oxidase with cupredoxin domain
MAVKRRSLLAGTIALASTMPSAGRTQGPRTDRKVLRLESRQIEVAGRAATRYGAMQASGTYGLVLDEGDTFDVRVENRLRVPSGIHWHGLTPPWRQDGVPYISAPPIAAGESADYAFPARPVGTRWMHSHFGLQEQNLLAAPLIVRETAAIRSGLQEVVALFEDFSWTNPATILADLRKPKPMAMSMARGTGGESGGGMRMSGPDLNDVEYDAFLANDRTVADPAVFDVGRGAEVRLRLINGAASSNFVIYLGGIEGTLLTVDGNPVQPQRMRQLPLATAQRADIVVRMPSDGSALPILALAEGRVLRAGFVLRPPGAPVTRIPDRAEMATPALSLAVEKTLRAISPLPARKVDRSVPVDLVGTMTGYTWGVQVHGMVGIPVTVERGERVELVMRNTTMMAHPMHLHGHNFQVTEIDGEKLAGAVRDTVLVPPMTTVKVVFDADNPGLWPYHCHNLFHMAAGMFTTVVYRGFA